MQGRRGSPLHLPVALSRQLHLLAKAMDLRRVDSPSRRRTVSRRSNCATPIHAHRSPPGSSPIRRTTGTIYPAPAGASQKRSAAKAGRRFETTSDCLYRIFGIGVSSVCPRILTPNSHLKSLLWMRRDIYNKSRSKRLSVRRSMNFWFTRTEKDMERRICAAAGAEGYNDIFKLLVGQQLCKLEKLHPSGKASLSYFSCAMP